MSADVRVLLMDNIDPWWDGFQNILSLTLINELREEQTDVQKSDEIKVKLVLALKARTRRILCE